MSQLILEWLNEDVGLSRHVSSLGEDFNDGYLLGELLYRHNQQANFDRFSNKDNPDAKINNFCLLEPTMRQVGVPFNSKIAQDIMNAKEGAVKNLLYEVKTALDSITRNSRQNGVQSNGAYGADKILTVIAPARPLYDRTMAATFENAVRTMIENPNEVLMESATRRFREKKTDFRQSISAGHTGMLQGLQSDLQRAKEIERHRKDHEGEFAEAWESINVNQWKANQKIARDRRGIKKRVEFAQTQHRDKVGAAVRSQTRSHTYASIDEFDNRLDATILASSSAASAKEPSSGSQPGSPTSMSSSAHYSTSLIKTVRGGPDGLGPELVYIDQEVLKAGLGGAQKKMKEHHEDTDARQQTNDRRRRRFLREFDTAQSKLSMGFFEKDVVTQLLNNSQSEVAESKEMGRALSHKQIIAENRDNRSRLIREQQEAQLERNAEWWRTEAQREIQWVVHSDLQSQLGRSACLQEAASAARRRESDELVGGIVAKIVDLAEWVISCRALGVFDYQLASSDKVERPAHGEVARFRRPQAVGGQVVPEAIWRDAAAMFTSALEIAKALPPPEHIDATVALLPFNIADRPQCVDRQWLFEQAFDSQRVLQRNVENCAADDALLSTAFESSIAEHLAAEDTQEFIQAVNREAADSQSEVSPTVPEPVPAEESDRDLMLTPEWVQLSATPSQFFLGETVIAIRCAVGPIPEEPAPVVDTAHIPLRAALCGISDRARKALAAEMCKQIPGLLVIRTVELVQQAFQSHVDALNCIAPAAEPALVTAADSTAPVVLDFVEQLPVDAGAAFTEAAWEGDVPDAAQSSAAMGDDEDAPPVAAPGPPTEPSEEEEVAAPLAAQQRAERYRSIAQQVYEVLGGGGAVSDELYVSLVVHAVQGVAPRNNGFVVADFPNTKAQALLLMEALSGTRYDLPKPQPYDRVSQYAPHKPCAEVLYDIGKCGLDVIVYLDNGDAPGGIQASLEERVRARRDLFSGEVLYMQDDCASVAGLQEVFDPLRPGQTAGLDLAVAQETNGELRELFARFQILDVLQVASFDSLEEAVQLKATQLVERFLPPENLLPDYFEVKPPVVEEVVDEDEQTAREEELLLAQGVPADFVPADDHPAAETVAAESKEVVATRPRPPPMRVTNSVPKRLAEALLRMWDLSEQQSQLKARRFFNAFRDVRYQFAQRRRCAADCLTYMLVRLDRRQELLDAFRLGFNELDSDMRFDPDCIAELHLQTLELGDAICREGEARRAAAQDYIKQVAGDAVLAMAVHRCSAESAVLAQAEVNRFYVALHLLFDFTRAVGGFDMQGRVLNELEATLPVTLSSQEAAPTGKGKEKPKEKESKKGAKDAAKAAPVPFREPVPAVLVPLASMSALPEPKLAEVAVDPKAKKPAKDKKGSEEAAPTSPFEHIEQLIAEDVAAKWSRGVFAVNRDLYEGDQSLCAALENAIWFEAEKLLKSIARIRRNLATQTQWLEQTESELLAVLGDMAETRFHRELAAGKVLLGLVAEAIEAADPIDELWVVAPDAVPPVNPRRVWQQFYASHPKHKVQLGLALGTKAMAAALLDSIDAADQALSTRPASGASVKAGSKWHGHGTQSLSARVDSAGRKHHTGPHHTPSHDEQDRAHAAGHAHNVTTDDIPASHDHDRHASHGGAHKPPLSGGDDQFRRQQEKYAAERKAFEERLHAQRHSREEDFKEMGMSPSCAKLAAFNELLLEEQHQMEDFEAHHKPRQQSHKHAHR